MAVTREQLYEEVWAEPMTKVAARYDVSSSFLARVCAALNVPRPPRGHWAKLAAGKPSPRPALPAARPGDEVVWSREGEGSWNPQPLPKAPKHPPRRRTMRRGTPASSNHRLLAGAEAHFLKTRSNEEGYFRPYKRLLMDLYVSKETLERALGLANRLYQHLEARGHRVTLAPAGEQLHCVGFDEREKERREWHREPWRPDRATVAYVGTVAIGLTLFELSESVEVRYVNGRYVPVTEIAATRRRAYGPGYSWTTTRDRPSGRLCLQAYSPYPGTKWVKQWREVKPGELAGRLESVVRELEGAAPTIAELVEVAEREAALEREKREAQWKKWQEEEAERRRQHAIKESREELMGIVEAWAEATRLAEFFADAERRVAGLPDEERTVLLERLRHARALAGGTDALERFRSWKSPEER
ncbi:hypothetical protein [Sediminicurvatus halobius]|uniref:Uncharacterized protein n=1 Tax=Sediminicurvatus halobius TaxID=2182432 RepID=A0A2U2MXA5_9GAMM|nr:hypothetical protein [Spiribacter halobius]PWG61495.1 hypothetical protein DEM34_16165 [Spiribacter halobius]UEX77966.1 hypothetical protein LMH63_18890 [Spiribacter halobius]